MRGNDIITVRRMQLHRGACSNVGPDTHVHVWYNRAVKPAMTSLVEVKSADLQRVLIVDFFLMLDSPLFRINLCEN